MKRQKSKETTMLTPREYGEKHGVAYSTVIAWLRKGLIAGSRKEALEAPFTGFIYRIPQDADPPALKPGPKPLPGGVAKAPVRKAAAKQKTRIAKNA